MVAQVSERTQLGMVWWWNICKDNSDVSFSGTGTISDNIARDGGGFWSKSSTIDW